MAKLFGSIETIFEIHPRSLDVADFQENWGKPKIVKAYISA